MHWAVVYVKYAAAFFLFNFNYPSKGTTFIHLYIN